jgi:urea carboxylase
MSQKYTNNDIENFDKIFRRKSFFKKSKNETNINVDKKISLKKDFTQDSLNENYFFKQKTIDDYEGFKDLYPHNKKSQFLQKSRPSIKQHINSDGSTPRILRDNIDSAKKSKLFQGAYDDPKYLPGGDKYILVEFGNVMNLELNFKAQGLAKAIENSKIKGVYETLPCFASMLVHYNSDEIKYHDLIRELKSLVGDLKNSDDVVVQSRLFQFPTVYLDKWTKEAVNDYISKISPKQPDPEYIVELNDLDDVNHFVRVHSGTEYWVASLGFWPGLPFTMPLDPRCRLSAPKYNPPRTWTPRGTVGMGGSSTAIYPDRLPGGYQIFGRTPVPIWDPEKRFSVFKDSICLFKPGDRIKFNPCSYEEFEEIERKVEEGTYKYEVMDSQKFSIQKYKNWLSEIDYNKNF